ncbi:MAG: phenylacetate--CoA ligase [Candidatus Methanomethylicota archaeon]|uniref:Phenylacetate--CoA ligase n=1 Tax=Thermoproteota archaeon TaxID=2056631 RepID=A0A497EQP8_9CREN|nr:MAG: phenylacetate--CoA ligase [Candidatus Verstraetearchaeota archaeon]
MKSLSKLPFTTKADLIQCHPFGSLAVPLSEVVRIHTSSGTTQKPIASFYTLNDLEEWSNLVARNLAAIGARKGDIFINTSSQGLFTGGLGYIQGAQKLGLTVIPLGSASPEKQLEYMKDFGVTVFHAIPSFALRIAEVAKQTGILDQLRLRLAILGAEPWTEAMRSKIEDSLGIEAFNNYGLAEVCGPGVAVECRAKSGLHVWEDHFIVEVVDPKTGENLDVEEEGELVITPLSREAMPLIRYRTGDIAKILDVRGCDCGRTHIKISWIKGRIDDMIKVRGIGLYPSAVEEVIATKKACTGHYLIVLRGLDELVLQVEVDDEVLKNGEAMFRLKNKIEEELKRTTMLRFDVQLLPSGSLPRSDGKAKRVVDERRWRT